MFDHILWRFLVRGDWIEPEDALSAIIETWQFFWGDEERAGYYWAIDADERQIGTRVLLESGMDARNLAALYYGSRLTQQNRWNDHRLALRDICRGLLARPPFPLSSDLLMNCSSLVAEVEPLDPPSPSRIVDEIVALSKFDTRANFLRTIEMRYGYPDFSCRFGKVDVNRDGQRSRVDCLKITAHDAISGQDIAARIAREWMRFEPLDYYRIEQPAEDGKSTKRLFLYDARDGYAIYWDKDLDGRPVELDSCADVSVPSGTMPWISFEISARRADIAMTERLKTVKPEQRVVGA